MGKSEITIPSGNELFGEIIHNYDESGQGWHFSAGNPEYWHFKDRLLVPGGKLLDVGIDLGRSSIFFALNGMQVVGYETNTERLKLLKEMVVDLNTAIPLSYDLRAEDFIASPTLETEAYDTVLIDHTLNHQSSKAAGLAILEKAYTGLKPGGHIFARVIGKQSSHYEELLYYTGLGYIRRGPWVQEASVRQIDDDVIEHPCACSGEERIESTLFFEQTDLLHLFTELGAEIVHSQCLPTQGRHNMMFGEDFNRLNALPDHSGTITVIAQKL